MRIRPGAPIGPLLILLLTLGLVGCIGPSTPVIGRLIAFPAPTATAAATGTPLASSPNATPSSSVQPTRSAVASRTVSPTATTRTAVTSVLDPASFPRPPSRDPLDLARRLRGGVAAVATASTPPNYKVGDSHTFWVLDQALKTPYRVTARIAYITDHAYMYVADGVALPDAGIKASADVFETQTYPLLHKYIGSEAIPGIDNDVHITILNAPIAGLGGYFSSLDTYPRSVNEYSNERDMVYINVDSAMPGTPSYDSTLAHEFTHMIQQNIMTGGEAWVKEGTAEVGARAAGQQSGGLDALYDRDPDIQLTDWAETPSQASAHYGAAYLFMTYYAQQYGGYSAIGSLLAGDGRGQASFDRYLASRGLNATFESIFRDWVVANYLDDKSLAGGRYGYDERRPVRPAAETIDALPYRSTTTVNQFGTDYYVIPAARGDLTISFAGQEAAKLVDVDAHGGKVQWWSNRGDEIDSRLTRKVDLTGTKKATLRFWTWFDLEENYDYAFVMVSTDAGKTWKTLSGQHTTTDNPNGGNFGSGFTGKSGTPAAWVQESMDLSPYAGKQILLRLEYITDDVYNAQGIGFDDFEIPEIGWKDDAETEGDWVAEGFVRTDNQLDQRFAVQVITQGKTTKVQSMTLDDQAKGQLVLRNVGPGQDITSVVIAVSGLAPLTNRPADYQISATTASIQPTKTPTKAPTKTPTPHP